MDIRQWRTVIPEKREANEVTSIALREFIGRSTGGTTKAEPGGFCELRRKSWASRETKLTIVHRIEYQKWESCTEGENSGNLQRVVWCILRIAHQSKCMRNLLKSRDRTIQIGRGNTSQLSHRDDLNVYSQELD